MGTQVEDPAVLADVDMVTTLERIPLVRRGLLSRVRCASPV